MRKMKYFVDTLYPIRQRIVNVSGLEHLTLLHHRSYNFDNNTAECFAFFLPAPYSRMHTSTLTSDVGQ